VCDRYPERLERAARIAVVEQEADALVRRLADRVHRSFATPIEARDLLALGEVVDSVVDRVDDVGDRLVLLRPPALPEEARAQARVLVRACERLGDATRRLAGFPDLTSEQEDVRALEREADALRLDATAKLFHSGLPPLQIVALKSVHEAIEAAVDACRDAANLLAAVALKNRW
jgi:uncharacterized protein Yka (UPF0111/DUF47 family)